MARQLGCYGVSRNRGSLVPLAVTCCLFFLAFDAPPVGASSCSAMLDIGAARVRWSKVRHPETSTLNLDQTCRRYFIEFLGAVEARETASTCKSGDERQRAIDILDGEIEAFNNLIAAQCGI
jgi:hypothetical protein